MSIKTDLKKIKSLLTQKNTLEASMIGWKQFQKFSIPAAKKHDYNSIEVALKSELEDINKGLEGIQNDGYLIKENKNSLSDIKNFKHFGSYDIKSPQGNVYEIRITEVEPFYYPKALKKQSLSGITADIMCATMGAFYTIIENRYHKKQKSGVKNEKP